MRMRTLIYFYWRRLRTHPVQEALAAFGVAIGVALVCSVQIANSSITAGSGQIVQSIGGPADYQVLARDAEGVPENVVSQISALPGVRRAAAVFDLAGSAQGPNGRVEPLQVASGSAMLWLIDGLGQRLLLSLEHNKNIRQVGANAVLLPSATAARLGVPTGTFSSAGSSPPVITLRIRGHATRVQVAAVLGPETVGTLSGAIAVIAPLELAQRLSGSQGRVTGALVEAQHGDRARVHRGLVDLAAGRLTVGPPNEDLALMRQATRPNTEATSFFAFVAGLVGLLLAWDAMLLSAPERRRLIADLRIQGARPKALVKLLIFQALCLGLVASAVGVLGGYLLARSVFHESPGYLAAAFPLGTQTIVTWQPVVFSLLGGMIVTCLAVAPPLFDLRGTRAIDAVYSERGEPGQALRAAWQRRLFCFALLLVFITSTALLFAPSAVVPAMVGLALATVLAVPYCFTIILRAALRVALASGKMNMVLMALRAAKATTLRCLALAATGAIAIFGVVVSEGAHADLLHGLYSDYAQYVGTAQVWVTNKGDELGTDSFPAGELAKHIQAVPGVSSVRDYQGGFLDVFGRRAWVIARSPQAAMMVSPSQIIQGNPARTLARLHAGGWITLSAQLASALHAHLGGHVRLPTPTGPVSYRLAATTSNLGWAGGAIVINDQDYRRAWQAHAPTALEVSLTPGANTGKVETAVQRLLGRESGLRVQSNTQRSNQADALAREGLSRLTQIAVMLTIAAALAMAAAMGASIWQRRAALASLRIQSFSPRQLRRVLFYECALVLGSGCTVGLVAGIYGHFLSDQFLRVATGFPAPFSPGVVLMAQTLLIVLLASLAVLTPPGYVASRASPRLALQE